MANLPDQRCGWCCPSAMVIIEERRSRIDNNPAGPAQRAGPYHTALYLNHPYAYRRFGWESEMRRCRPRDALAPLPCLVRANKRRARRRRRCHGGAKCDQLAEPVLRNPSRRVRCRRAKPACARPPHVATARLEFRSPRVRAGEPGRNIFLAPSYNRAARPRHAYALRGAGADSSASGPDLAASNRALRRRPENRPVGRRLLTIPAPSITAPLRLFMAVPRRRPLGRRGSRAPSEAETKAPDRPRA